MQIRRLTEADADLWRDIRLEALERDGEQFATRHEDWAARPLSDFAHRLQDGAVWAAVAEGRALAVAARGSDAADPRRGWLESVYSRPEARRRGLARAVIAALEAEARAEGLRDMWLEVRGDNHAAHSLYHDLGYAEAAVPQGAACCGGCERAMCKRL